MVVTNINTTSTRYCIRRVEYFHSSTFVAEKAGREHTDSPAIFTVGGALMFNDELSGTTEGMRDVRGCCAAGSGEGYE